MTRAGVIAGSATAVLLAVAWGVFAYQPASDVRIGNTSAPDLETGRRLYDEVCASCHGANLEGQPNWREAGGDGVFPAPPHDESGHTWHHPDRVLFDYVKRGGAAVMTDLGADAPSGMPGFGDQLSDAEIAAVLSFIKSTWSERARQIQAERTRIDHEQGGT